MAITINGSGTITGISAGGLPDGSVTAADLADTYLTGVTSSNLPSGSVLQVQEALVNGAANTSSTSFVWAGHSANITTTRANSKILVMNNTAAQQHSGWGQIALRSSVDSYASNLQTLLVMEEIGNWAQSGFPMLYLHSPNQSSGTTITYRDYFKSGDGSHSTYYFDGWGQEQTYRWVLMEIAP